MEPISTALVVGTQLGTTALNIQGAKIASKRQLKYQKELAGYQADINQRYLREQLAYNSPAQQMMRYKAAGINPNMVISQGNPGNQGAPLSYPEIQAPDVQYERGIGTQVLNGVMDIIMKSRQAELLESQASLNNVKKDSETINQDLKKVQIEIAKANPYLNKEYLGSIITQMQSVAALKKQEADFMLKSGSWMTETGYNQWEVQVYQNGIRKMEKELEILEAKYNLSKQDQKIKAEILQSKEFANTISEIQMKWLKDGEINADIVKQFIFLLISRFR